MALVEGRGNGNWLENLAEGKTFQPKNCPGGSNPRLKHCKAWELPAELAGPFIYNMLQ